MSEDSDMYMKRTQFTLERTYAAPPERVYKAWIDPDDLARWIWASLGKNVWSELDLRVGGAYRIYSEIEGGRHRGEGWSGMCGLYVEVEPARRLAFTLHWDADVGYNAPDALTLDELVTVTFAAQGDGTRMTMTHFGIPDDGQSVMAHEQGMAQALDMLGVLVGSSS